ncbi:MAG: hypothetical protein M3Y33_02245 [Actinomycetota bacterium]|nr:hypothetical protein [Actinomycetota bacterium]
MSAGYTFTTITNRPDEPVKISASLYLDEGAWIKVYGLDADSLHLSISQGDLSVAIGLHSGQVTTGEARIARVLADEITVYAAEVERRLAAQDADETGTAAA